VEDKAEVSKVFALAFLGLALLACIALPGAAIAMWLSGIPVPVELANWASGALGLLFGLIPTLVQHLWS
jgi:hypothetical protein